MNLELRLRSRAFERPARVAFPRTAAISIWIALLAAATSLYY